MPLISCDVGERRDRDRAVHEARRCRRRSSRPPSVGRDALLPRSRLPGHPEARPRPPAATGAVRPTARCPRQPVGGERSAAAGRRTSRSAGRRRPAAAAAAHAGRARSRAPPAPARRRRCRAAPAPAREQLVARIPSGPRAVSWNRESPTILLVNCRSDPVRLVLATSEANTSATPTAMPATASSSWTSRCAQPHAVEVKMFDSRIASVQERRL